MKEKSFHADFKLEIFPSQLDNPHAFFDLCAGFTHFSILLASSPV